MLCTECFETSHPETSLAGSDRIEMVAWLCFALPGWLYCCWRHALRIKVCGVCGSRSLVREARAAAVREPEALTEPAPRVSNLNGPVRWPRPFSTPRDRLHAGAPGVLASLVALLGGAVTVTSVAPLLLPAICFMLSSMLAAAWLVHGGLLWFRTRSRLCGARAWTQDGRTIHIEVA
jgi:hypothetical protein